MKFFRALRKLYNYLTLEEVVVSYESTQEFDISEKNIEEENTLKINIENPYVEQVREWAVKKINLLHESDRHRNAKALSAEFNEWINIPEGVHEIDYLCLEDQEWTDEQEIDVR